MRYKVNIGVEWYSTLNDEYQVCREDREINAISHKHALGKAIKIGQEWDCYKDRVDYPSFRLSVEAKILE